MPKETRPMVLRSINLPPELDDQLRAVAFALRRPKSDLIRMFVAEGLGQLTVQLRSAAANKMQEIFEHIARRIAESGSTYSTQEREQFEEDFARMQRFIDRKQGRQA